MRLPMVLWEADGAVSSDMIGAISKPAASPGAHRPTASRAHASPSRYRTATTLCLPGAGSPKRSLYQLPSQFGLSRSSPSATSRRTCSVTGAPEPAAHTSSTSPYHAASMVRACGASSTAAEDGATASPTPAMAGASEDEDAGWTTAAISDAGGQNAAERRAGWKRGTVRGAGARKRCRGTSLGGGGVPKKYRGTIREYYFRDSWNRYLYFWV